MRQVSAIAAISSRSVIGKSGNFVDLSVCKAINVLTATFCVVELKSSSDTLSTLKAKLLEYLHNGATLGFVIDRKQG